MRKRAALEGFRNPYHDEATCAECLGAECPHCHGSGREGCGLPWTRGQGYQCRCQMITLHAPPAEHVVTTSDGLRKATAALEAAKRQHEALVVARLAEGASLRTVAEEAGVSHQQVKRVRVRGGTHHP